MWAYMAQRSANKSRALVGIKLRHVQAWCVFLLNCRHAVIIEKVASGVPPFYRPVPHVDNPEVHQALVIMMKQCWAEQPNDRPSFDDVVKMFKHVNNGK